ncbi:MAG: bifunctional nuclease family protein [Planctomycetota bacterium]|jgi:bifunctional DNase/RNase
MDRMVECELARIIIHENSDQQYIWLREKGGSRHFPIVIAIMEALAIDRFVKDEQTQRPLTHELLHRALTALGAEVERVEVTKLQDHTFYANLVLRRDGEQFEIDARPSDAIAIAVRNNASIYVHEDVLKEVASASDL